jgi:mutator protein MutT
MMENSSSHKRVGVGVIYNEEGEILIDRRLDRGFLGGLWEFPGGKIEANETVEDCIEREILEELGIEIEVGQRLITIEHTYNNFSVTLIVHLCRHISGEPQLIECAEVRWVKREEIDSFNFPEANKQIIAALKNLAVDINGEIGAAPS